jgi:hypothetical protein
MPPFKISLNIVARDIAANHWRTMWSCRHWAAFARTAASRLQRRVARPCEKGIRWGLYEGSGKEELWIWNVIRHSLEMDLAWIITVLDPLYSPGISFWRGVSLHIKIAGFLDMISSSTPSMSLHALGKATSTTSRNYSRLCRAGYSAACLYYLLQIEVSSFNCWARQW